MAHYPVNVLVVEGSDHDAFAWGERGHGANVPRRYAVRDSSVVSMVAVKIDDGPGRGRVSGRGREGSGRGRVGFPGSLSSGVENTSKKLMTIALALSL